MYHFLQKFHSGWAYLVLLLLIVCVINAVIGFTGKKDFTGKDKKIGLFTLIFVHVQLVVGLILYFISPIGQAALGQISNPELRITALEHPLINVIAVILITVGWSKHKKQEAGTAKFKSFMIFYGLGLLLILSRIPWKLWI